MELRTFDNFASLKKWQILESPNDFRLWAKLTHWRKNKCGTKFNKIVQNFCAIACRWNVAYEYIIVKQKVDKIKPTLMK